MLTVSQAQLRAFHGLEERFQRRLESFVLEQVPDAALGKSPAVFSDRVRASIALARHRGLTWESSIAAYVCLMFAVHPLFERQPRIAAVFKDPSVKPDHGIDLLQSRVSAEDWSDAAKQPVGADQAWVQLSARLLGNAG